MNEQTQTPEQRLQSLITELSMIRKALEESHQLSQQAKALEQEIRQLALKHPHIANNYDGITVINKHELVLTEEEQEEALKRLYDMGAWSVMRIIQSKYKLLMRSIDSLPGSIQTTQAIRIASDLSKYTQK
jgi:alpha-amylase/alpha-mannosidase (GH57 family)